MKITTKQLGKVILEELDKVLSEKRFPWRKRPRVSKEIDPLQTTGPEQGMAVEPEPATPTASGLAPWEDDDEDMDIEIDKDFLAQQLRKRANELEAKIAAIKGEALRKARRRGRGFPQASERFMARLGTQVDPLKQELRGILDQLGKVEDELALASPVPTGQIASS